jgi:GTPase SAR1 family protein
MAQLKKSDLIKILVEEFGYEREDIKLLTIAKLQILIDTEKQELEELEKAKAKATTRVIAKKSSVKDDEQIIVMNGLTGALRYHSERTNRTWEFDNFGQQDVMEFSELKIIRNRFSRFFKEGWLIVLDPEAQRELGLIEMYENIITPENVEEVFKMDAEDLNEFIDALPEGQKLSFVNMAQERVERGQLDSNKIIKMIEDKFNFDFETNAPKNDIVSTREKVGSANIIVVDRVR